MPYKNRIIYNKLVRDKIPEIIEADGKKCETEIVSNEKAKILLAEKIKEEAADILEVVYSLINKSGWTIEEIENIRKQKADKRGGFYKNIFLLNTFEI